MNSEIAAELTRCNQNILECLREHKDVCPAPLVYSPRWLNSFPLRLLDVHRHADRVYLVPGETTSSPYATLSYVWGTVQPVMMLLEDLHSHMIEGILIDVLPKTIRDAIAIARWFKLNYVWIDALCIVQDDLAEWRVESAKMDSIYMGAYFTIAAVDADNCQRGFIDRSINRDNGTLQWTSGGLKKIPFYPTGPLFTRGWTLQERLLSSRIMYFTAYRGIHYECSNNAQALVPGDTIGRFRGQTSAATANFLRNWIYLISMYSLRHLTIKSDVLVALHGLIKYLRTRTGFDIVYGHWRHEFLHQLFWYRSVVQQYGTTGVAPSWSWASGVGALSWPVSPRYGSKGPVYNADSRLSRVQELDAEHQGVLNSVAAFPYASLDDQVLSVNGFVLPIMVMDKEHRPISEPLRCAQQLVISSANPEITISPVHIATVKPQPSRKKKAVAGRVEKRTRPQMTGLAADKEPSPIVAVQPSSSFLCNIYLDQAELATTTFIFMLQTSSPQTGDSSEAYLHFLLLELVHEPNYFQRVGFGRSTWMASPEQTCRLRGISKQEIFIV